MNFTVNSFPSRRVEDRQIGPIVATSPTGQKLVSAEARFVGEVLALQFLSVSPTAADEVCAAVLGVTGILAVINSITIPFVADGRAFRAERSVAEGLGYVEQTATVYQRLDLFWYPCAPTGALILDPTSPIPSAKFVLDLLDRDLINIPYLKLNWMRELLIKLALEGMPLPDRPSKPRWFK